MELNFIYLFIYVFFAQNKKQNKTKKWVGYRFFCLLPKIIYIKKQVEFSFLFFLLQIKKTTTCFWFLTVSIVTKNKQLNSTFVRDDLEVKLNRKN